MELPTFERLLSPDGQALLAEVRACAGVESDLALGTRLRRRHDPALVAAAVTQNHLRGQAGAKLGSDAAFMYFTSDSLQQATRARVAEHRAVRMASAGRHTAVDLGCGIGADLIALSRAGLSVQGVDLDTVRVRIARANLAALGLDGDVRVADATTVDRSGADVCFVDPARRDGAEEDDTRASVRVAGIVIADRIDRLVPAPERETGACQKLSCRIEDEGAA